MTINIITDTGDENSLQPIPLPNEQFATIGKVIQTNYDYFDNKIDKGFEEIHNELVNVHVKIDEGNTRVIDEKFDAYDLLIKDNIYSFQKRVDDNIIELNEYLNQQFILQEDVYKNHIEKIEEYCNKIKIDVKNEVKSDISAISNLIYSSQKQTEADMLKVYSYLNKCLDTQKETSSESFRNIESNYKDVKHNFDYYKTTTDNSIAKLFAILEEQAIKLDEYQTNLSLLEQSNSDKDNLIADIQNSLSDLSNQIKDLFQDSHKHIETIEEIKIEPTLPAIAIEDIKDQSTLIISTFKEYFETSDKKLNELQDKVESMKPKKGFFKRLFNK